MGTRLTIVLLATVCANAALPEPPKQHEPWTPPTTHAVPDYVIKVAATLFTAGLGDPRGGEYREVELPTPRKDKATLKTHAWVFAGKSAVAWNGTVYRVTEVGEPADLEQDVRIIVDAGPWSGPFPMRREPPPEKAAFFVDMELGQPLAPTSLCLLLRLGRSDLADLIWQSRASDEGTWLSTAATAWLGAAYWRLVGAFGRGDDQEAVDVAESIVQWRSDIPQDARYSFLNPVPGILADSQRRLLQSGGAASRTLIERLEDVRGEKMTFPGTLSFSFDPVYEELTKKGDATVDALLDAYENDRRLTRTFDYSRPWMLERKPVPVHDVVRLLLGDILGDRGFVENATPTEVRIWWGRHHSDDRAVRSFEVLADDDAGATRWLQSATYLTMRSDIEWSDGHIMQEDGACDPRKATPPLYGERLRSRQSPSVTELLAKRTATLVNYHSELACHMAVKAALWDSRTALPVLQTAAQLKSCRWDALVVVSRYSLSDIQATADWAVEMRNRPEFPPLSVEDLSPLWIFPADPALKELAEWLFARPESPWYPGRVYTSVNSALLSSPSYRRAVRTALDDARVVAPGQDRPLRVKDMVAWELSNLEGAPPFGIDWREPDKDRAISEIIDFLAAHVREIRAFPARLSDTSCIGQRVYLSR